MKKIFIFIFILTAFIDSKAQLFPTLGGQRAGISTAEFLKIGVGSRSSSMGDAFVAIANDASALYWNPAGLVQFNQDQVMFSHNQWVVDISNDFLGAVYHLDGTNAFGLAVTSLSTQDMPVTTEFSPFGTGEYFSYGDLAFAVTYSRKMTDKFSFGGTVRYIEETLDKLKMRGVMIDLGTYDWQSFSPPTIFRIGFAFEPYESGDNKITTSVQLNHPNDNSENVSTGFEYSWKNIVFLRGGYLFNVPEQNYSFGFGVNIPIRIAFCEVDYSYSNFTLLGNAQRFSIILGF